MGSSTHLRKGSPCARCGQYIAYTNKLKRYSIIGIQSREMVDCRGSCYSRSGQLWQWVLNLGEDVPETLPQLFSLEISGGSMPTQTCWPLAKKHGQTLPHAATNKSRYARLNTSMHKFSIQINVAQSFYFRMFLMQKLHQQLIPSSHKMDECQQLPGAQAPRVPRQSWPSALRLLNSSDWPGGKESLFSFPLSKSRGPIHHLTRYTSCSQGSGDGGSRVDRGVEKARGTPKDKFFAWRVGQVLKGYFVMASLHLKPWLNNQSRWVRRKQRRWERIG